MMDASLQDRIERCVSTLPDPPGPAATVHDEGSWYSVVTAKDRSVLWRFVCEKSVLRLEASPIWAANDSFDADLLARHFLGVGLANVNENVGPPIPISVEDLVSELRRIRQPVLEGFQEESWPDLRKRLLKLGRRRDFELLGRPLPPEDIL